jgi:hypothetical protein
MRKWEQPAANTRVLAPHQFLDFFGLLSNWGESRNSVQRIPSLPQQQVLSRVRRAIPDEPGILAWASEDPPLALIASLGRAVVARIKESERSSRGNRG